MGNVIAGDFPWPSRILVTGNAGSGKSTLARQLGEALSLPTYGLDAILWRPGWTSPPAEERQRLLTELAAGSRVGAAARCLRTIDGHA